MLYYIYYGYLGGYTLYKMYEYSHKIHYVYKTLYFTYKLTSGAYNIICEKKDNIIEDKNWEILEKIH